MKILISGGHLTPALSLIDYCLARTDHADELVFVGRQYSQVSFQQESVERAEVEKRGIKFIEFDAGKLLFGQPIYVTGQLLKSCKSVWKAWQIFQQEQPHIFVSFGGYLAAPLALIAWLKGIRIVTHEQTMAAGMANRFIALLANKVAVSFPETAHSFPAKKVVVTGNPLREKLWQPHPPKPTWALAHSQRPLLYVTGGSQGSQAINLLMQKILPSLLPEWDVIHQCGKANSLMNYAQSLQTAQQQLPAELQARYVVREWVSEDELAWIYAHAWAMISRSGANTVQEVIQAQIPTLFIPLAHAHHDEQTKNAQFLVQKNAAVLLLQKELDEAHLLLALNQLKQRHQEIAAQLQQLATKAIPNPTERLYQVVMDVLHAA